MTRLNLLLLLLLAGFCSLSFASIFDDNEELTTECPEHCKCMHSAMYMRHVECTKITRTQFFTNSITSFTLDKDTEENAQPVELTKNFFLELGRPFKNIDYMIITADISRIDPDAFQGLNNMRNLNISNNGLTYIHPDTFSNNKALRMLALTRNPLTFGEYFLNSTVLSELDLSFCQIHELPETAFIGVQELLYLNLASNLIDTIHPKAFEPLLVLEELNLAHNNLRNLNPDIFLHNEGLNILRLDYNPLSSIENLKMPNVKELHLQHCNFTELTSTTFASYIDTTYLNLSGNKIEKMSLDTFSKLEVLMYLDLSSNKLGPLDSRLFLANHDLQALNLRDNPTMSVWPEEGFHGNFNMLHLLDISNIGIKSLSINSLKNMSNLAQLYLRKNVLTGFEKGVLPRKIIVLSLADNEITSIDDINVSSEHNIHQLFLQGNKIKNLALRNFENMPNLSSLDVSSCEMESIWLEEQIGEQKFINLNQLKVAKNKLQKMLPNDLNVFPHLAMLDIRGNPFVCNQDLSTLINYLQNSSIEPVGSSDIGNIDQNYERFEWDDIVTANCNSSLKVAQKPSEKVNQESTVPNSPKSMSKETGLPLKTNTLTVDEREFPVGDMYEDIITNDNDDFEYDQDNYETTRLPHRQSVLAPQVVEVSDTSPVVVAFLSALLMTVFVTLTLALLAALCKQKFTNIGGIQNSACKERSTYGLLLENEHVNSSTTPIVKKRAQLSEVDVHGKTDSYIYNTNDGTYSSTDFHHANITPQTV